MWKIPKRRWDVVVSITVSNSSGKLNLLMPICHRLLSFCCKKACNIAYIRKTFTPFRVAPFLKGLMFFIFLSIFLFFFCFDKEEGREIGCSVVSLYFERKDLKLCTHSFNVTKLFLVCWYFGFIFKSYLTNKIVL